jgi:hypothetical protein
MHISELQVAGIHPLPRLNTRCVRFWTINHEDSQRLVRDETWRMTFLSRDEVARVKCSLGCKLPGLLVVLCYARRSPHRKERLAESSAPSITHFDRALEILAIVWTNRHFHSILQPHEGGRSFLGHEVAHEGEVNNERAVDSREA